MSCSGKVWKCPKYESTIYLYTMYYVCMYNALISVSLKGS
jgi:hypothetical protein